MAEVDRPSAEVPAIGSTARVVESSDPSGAPVIAITGELDISSAASVREVVERVVATAPEKLVFDLSALEFMDSTGIAILVIAADQVATVEVRDPPKMIRRTIELSGLVGTLEVTP